MKKFASPGETPASSKLRVVGIQLLDVQGRRLESREQEEKEKKKQKPHVGDEFVKQNIIQ